MNSKHKGDITESRIIFEFTKLNIPVLIPFGDNQRYDLVIEVNGYFKRIQCKTGKLINGVVRFYTCSSQMHRGNGKQSYYGQIDYFAVYCPQLDKSYIIPIEDSPASACHLRIDKPKKKDPSIRWAKDYMIENFPP